MYTYVISGQSELKIDVSTFCSPDDGAEWKIVERTSEYVRSRLTYPNGFVVDAFQYPGKIVINSNYELIDNGNGKFNVLLP